MATNTTSTAQGAPRPGVTGYETRDANAPRIFGIVLFLICGGILIHLGLLGLLRHLIKSPAPTDIYRTIAHPNQPARPVPSPRLQVSERLDLLQFRAKEDEQLTNFGWVNRKAGIVRVPIERAMDLVLQKGLAIRTNPAGGRGPSPGQLIEERSAARQPAKQP